MTTTPASASLATPLSAPPSAPPSAWQSPWVRAWIALVVVVLAVNLVMVTLAVVTNPGLVVKDYYERGRAMEESIRSRAAVATPEWMLQADIPSDLTAGRPSIPRLFVVDKVGQPIRPDAVHFFAYRPADANQDFSLRMIEEAPGRYGVEVTFPLPGVWDILIEVTQGETKYQLDQRLIIHRPQS